jgi:cyanate lyase
MATKANEPIQTIEYNNNYISNGLTKREYFAAMALQGLLANNNNYVYSVISAVEFADDLIEELSKTKTNEKK